MAVDAPRKPFYSSRNPRASYTQGNQFDPGNPGLAVLLAEPWTPDLEM
jgi:hypothetical protein